MPEPDKVWIAALDLENFPANDNYAFQKAFIYVIAMVEICFGLLIKLAHGESDVCCGGASKGIKWLSAHGANCLMNNPVATQIKENKQT